MSLIISVDGPDFLSALDQGVGFRVVSSRSSTGRSVRMPHTVYMALIDSVKGPDNPVILP